jgi:hypothetical protein
MYPMSRADFYYWLRILKKHFPDHAMFSGLGKTWYPTNSGACYRCVLFLLGFPQKMRMKRSQN